MTHPNPTIFMPSRRHCRNSIIYLISFILYFASTVVGKAQDADKPRRHKYRIDHNLLLQRKYGPFRLYPLVIAGWMIHATIVIKKAMKLYRAAGS
jgi:hypothetical protein